MTITAELADGRRLEFPDGTDPVVIQTTVKKILGQATAETARPQVIEQQSRVFPEIGKGLLRGASEFGLAVPKAVGSLRFGPLGGSLLSKGVETLAAPSREMVKATTTNEAEKFAGTAAEIAGGSIAGGGAGTIRGVLMTGGAALSGAAGEQLGGDLGKFLGIVAGSYGIGTAHSIARKLGQVTADIGATIGAAFGSKRGIERLASKSITTKAGEEAPRIKQALESPTSFIPGAKITAGEAITEAQMGKPGQFGGAIVRTQKDLYGAPGIEDVLPTVSKQQASSVEKHLSDLAAKTGPMREKALESANKLGGVSPALVNEQITAIANEPGIGASKVIQKVLATVKEDIANLKSENGLVNAKDLYTIRKEIGNTIQLHAKETANWDKHLSSGLQRRVQVAIDDAIEAAGGKGWKEYLATESAGRKAVENFEARQKAMKLLQAGVKGQSPGQVVSGEILHPPTLLNRPMMLVNWALKLIAHDANDPVVKRVANAISDPQEFSKLIKLPITHPDRKALHYVLNALVSTKLDEAAKSAIGEMQ